MKGILFKPDVWAVKKRVLEQYGEAQTRRLNGLKEINQEPNAWFYRPQFSTPNSAFFVGNKGEIIVKPRYQVGEVAYIKEAWSPWADEFTKKVVHGTEAALYRMDYKEGCPCLDIGGDYNWHSPLFMPSWAARDFIKITDVRPERLQDISQEDAKAEGATCHWDKGEPFYEQALEYCRIAHEDWPNASVGSTYKLGYQFLWDSINKKYPWPSNPWVWRYVFEPVISESSR